MHLIGILNQSLASAMSSVNIWRDQLEWALAGAETFPDSRDFYMSMANQASAALLDALEWLDQRVAALDEWELEYGYF